MPLGLQKIKLEPNEDCRVPDLSSSPENARNAAQSKTVQLVNDCRIDEARTKIKRETGSIETEMIYTKVEAELELKPNPKTMKTRKRLPMETVGEVGKKLKRKKMQKAPCTAVQLSLKKTLVASSGKRGRKKCIQMVQTRALPIPIQPKVMPSATVPDHQEKLQITKPCQNDRKHSKVSIPVASATSQLLKKASAPGSDSLQNQASLQQPTHLHPCSSGQQTVLNSCQNPVFIQVCGSQLAGSTFNSSNQVTCNPLVLPQTSVSIQLAGNTVMPGISMMPPGYLSVKPQLQFQSGTLVNNQGSLQIRIPLNQVVQTQQSSLNSLIPNHLVQGNFKNPIHIQIPANQLVQTNAQNQVQINFPSSQLVQHNMQNPIQIQLPSTQLVQSGSQNTVQINTCTSSSQLVQNPIHITIPARQVVQTNPKITAPVLLPSLQSRSSKITIKSPVLIKTKNPQKSVTVLPNSTLIQNSTGQTVVQTCVLQKNRNCDPCGQSSKTRSTRSKTLSNLAQVSRKQQKPKCSAQPNLGSKIAARTQKHVFIQPSSMGTPKFIPIQPSINHLPQHSSPQNSLQVQVLSHNVLNAVPPQSLSTTISNPSILEKPALLQVVDRLLETSQASASNFRIVQEYPNQLETSGATLELHLPDSSKNPARTNLRGEAVQQTAKKRSAAENSRSHKIATRLLKTSVSSPKHESILPKRDSSRTSLQGPGMGCSGRQLMQSALQAGEVAKLPGQLTGPASSKDAGETIIVLGGSNLGRFSDTQCVSVSVPNIVSNKSQSKTAVAQRKARSRFVPILPRPSDNQMCIFNQTANDEGSFWGAGKKNRKLIRNAVKRTTSITIQKPYADGRPSCQELLAGQKCFVQLEMLNVEPNKFYSATDFKTVKPSNLRSRRQRTVKHELVND